MADNPAVVERGVLTADGARWQPAVRRAEVIGRLAQQDRVSVAAADEAAAELELKRRQVYELVKRAADRGGCGVGSVAAQVQWWRGR